MNFFTMRQNVLHVENVSLVDIAQRYGTPCYVYSRAALCFAAQEFQDAFHAQNTLICYSVKVNSNIAILNEFARLGFGFDIVSGGELARVLAAGGDARKVVFSGVGKTVEEMEAALNAGIKCFNLESAAEMEALATTAQRLGKQAPISFRINPDVDPKTHPYISTGLRENKFGIPLKDAHPLYRRARQMSSLRVVGIDMHIGSQITDIAPYREAAQKLVTLLDVLEKDGIALEHVDIGGGLGVRYRDDDHPPAIADFAAMCREIFSERHEQLILEPGRRLVAEAGILLTQILYLKPGKPRSFAIVDGAMNDLFRPALYQAWHPVHQVTITNVSDQTRLWNIVGPICESADFLAQDRQLALRQGELLAIGVAGAYGMAMSSNYNSRPRVCEVMVDNNQIFEIRKRETVASLFSEERIPYDKNQNTC